MADQGWYVTNEMMCAITSGLVNREVIWCASLCCGYVNLIWQRMMTQTAPLVLSHWISSSGCHKAEDDFLLLNALKTGGEGYSEGLFLSFFSVKLSHSSVPMLLFFFIISISLWHFCTFINEDRQSPGIEMWHKPGLNLSSDKHFGFICLFYP